MADYIYLLENRLSPAQRQALTTIREIVRSKGMTVFLVGGAVRDLTAGTSVRDLDVAVQGNALKLKKDIEKSGAEFSGENEAGQALFFRFPGGVRVEIGSTLSVQYPKPGKPVYHAANILEDLRRRDFTANAMALSLNEGSYGLLMDPLNGVADIENRELRLVSNYGFIEDPARLIRASRLSSRLGWSMEERTRTRYENGKEEGFVSALSAWNRGYELEEIAHEEDALRVLRTLENEGWMKVLNPAWTQKVANATAVEELRDKQGQLQIQGIYPDVSASAFPLLTAKMAPKDVAALKKSFPRQGFVDEIENLEGLTKAFSAEFTGKAAAAPSAAWKLLHSASPEAVLHLAYSGKGATIQNKFKAFFTEWPQARVKIPYALMQEMRITPDLPEYDELVEKLFFELMDGKLGTVEEMKAFLEPYSPPAPPPPVHLRRARAVKKETKRAKKSKAEKVAPEGVAAEAAPETSLIEVGDVATKPEKTSKAKAEKQGKSVPITAEKLAPIPVKAATKTVPVKIVAKKAAPPTKADKNAAPAKTPAKKALPVKKVAPAVKKVIKKTVPAKPSAKKVVPAKKAVAKKLVPLAKKSAPVSKKPLKIAAKKKR